MSTIIDTDLLSSRFRANSIDVIGRRLLTTNFCNTEQEKDLTEPPNCGGVGRIRHFRRVTSVGWPCNSLPIDPACCALGLSATDMLRAQVFQYAACNWRCWYCFVPFNLLAANPKYSEWVSPDVLIKMYLNQPHPPLIIDLTGGQPDIAPEWVLWMMQELKAQGLEREVYLWSDDNLSNDYFWRYLSDEDREFIADYANYGRVCCFKGFNETSFSFNTKADRALFNQQFDLFSRLLNTGMDLYAYVTLTTPVRENIADDMARFVDRLQQIHHDLPLRVVPLEIQVYTPVEARMGEAHQQAILHQNVAIEAWQSELEHRFSSVQRQRNITEISICGGTR